MIITTALLVYLGLHTNQRRSKDREKSLKRETRNITLPNCFGNAKVYLKNIYGKYLTTNIQYWRFLRNVKKYCSRILTTISRWVKESMSGRRWRRRGRAYLISYTNCNLSLVGRTNISCTACLMAKIYPLKAQINTYSQRQPSCRRVPTLPVLGLHGPACETRSARPGLWDLICVTRPVRPRLLTRRADMSTSPPPQILANSVEHLKVSYLFMKAIMWMAKHSGLDDLLRWARSAYVYMLHYKKKVAFFFVGDMS